ncbi:MAG TPA: hypothetical protein VMR16_01490 [Candidatus Saccharimonadales bacterium]|nr:hypothetical protein [Candidatus Saccharimonadales bacterium]
MPEKLDNRQVDTTEQQMFTEHKRLANKRTLARVAELADQGQVLMVTDLDMSGLGVDHNLLGVVKERLIGKTEATKRASFLLEAQSKEANRFATENLDVLIAQAKSLGVSYEKDGE